MNANQQRVRDINTKSSECLSQPSHILTEVRENRAIEQSNLSSSLIETSKTNPCPHCGKPDWCYSIGELSVCKRASKPAQGWMKTSKADAEGNFYYAPVQVKAVRSKSRKEYIYHDRNGQPLIKVTRIDDGQGKKEFFQSHWNGKQWVKRLTDGVKARIPIYRYTDVRKAIASGEIIFLVEGEGVADLLWSLGLAATTTIGGSGNYRSYGDYKTDLEGASLVLCPDRDQPGVKHMEEVFKDFPDAKWLYAPPNNFYWEHLPESKGLDLGDWILDGATLEDILSQIQESPKPTGVGFGSKSRDFGTQALEQTPNTLNPDVTFNQQGINFLYGDKHWISADGKLYYWDGNHYKYSPDSVERPKIASYCNSYVVFVDESTGGGRRATYPYAKTSAVEELLKWVKMRVEINPDLLNPPGINCTNGVVGVKWNNGKPVRCIEPHDPTKHYFTYEPLVKYDPLADPTDCDRLLECLDEPQQQVLLRNLAASIDLAEVRKRRGREVKLLLACGLGSNGKDALRQTVSTIFGHSGMTSVSLADFAHYDDGRKFALAPLMSSRVNWASENPQTAS